MATKYNSKDYYYQANIDGKTININQAKLEENGGWAEFEKEYPNAKVRMRDGDRDALIPVGKVSWAQGKGAHVFKVYDGPSQTAMDATRNGNKEAATQEVGVAPTASPEVLASPEYKNAGNALMNTIAGTGNYVDYSQANTKKNMEDAGKLAFNMHMPRIELGEDNEKEASVWNNRNAVRTDNGYKLSTGDYATTRAEANEVQGMLDRTERGMVKMSIEDLEKEVNGALDKRTIELEKEKNNEPWYVRMVASRENDPLGNYKDDKWAILSSAAASLTDAKRMVAEAEKNEGGAGFWTGAGRGLRDKVFDPRTWDGGASDGYNNVALLRALDKADKNEKLSKEEEMLLDAKATEMAVQAYFGSSIGMGYKAGQVTAEAIPFMIEMAINPASKLGETAASKLTRYALKKFAGKASKKLLARTMKVGGRIAGDIAGANLMTATTSMPGVMNDTMERMQGTTKYGIGPGGIIQYNGREDAQDIGDAFSKAFKARVIENHSEMLGEYFSPIFKVSGKMGGKALEKMKLGAVKKFLDNVNGNRIAQAVNDFAKQTKWNGTIGEYSEEVLGGIENALLVGDQTLDTDKETGVFNKEKNIETFLGVALMGGFMSTVKTLGYKTKDKRERLDMRQQMIESADRGLAAFGGDVYEWGRYRNKIAIGRDEDVMEAVNEALSNPYLSQEGKEAVLDFAKKAMQYKGMKLGKKKAAEMNIGSQEALESLNAMNADGQMDFGANRLNEVFDERGADLDLNFEATVAQARMDGRSQYDAGDYKSMRENRMRSDAQLAVLKESVGDDAMMAVLSEDANERAAYRMKLQGADRALYDAACESRSGYLGAMDAFDAAHAEERERGGSIINDVMKGDVNGAPRQAFTAEVGDVTIAIVGGVNADGSLTDMSEGSTGRVMGVPVAVNNGVVDWRTFDAGEVRSYEVTGEFQVHSEKEVEESVYQDWTNDNFRFIDYLPEVGEEFELGAPGVPTAKAVIESMQDSPQGRVAMVRVEGENEARPMLAYQLNGAIQAYEYQKMEQEVREEYYNNAMGDVPANQPGQPVEVVQQQEPATEQAGAQESTEEQPVVQADAQQMGEAPAALEPVDYETADAASIVRDLMERRGYTSEVVGDYIAQRIEQAKEALKKTEKMVKPEFKDPLPKLKNADLEKYDTDMAAWNVKKARINARTKQYEADKAAAVQAAQAEIDRWQGVQDYITGEAAARAQAEREKHEEKMHSAPIENESENTSPLIGRSLTSNETEQVIASMEQEAITAPTIELTPENWIQLFGEKGEVETPLSKVKMGENQYFKIAQQGRNGKLGMVKPTLEYPSIIIEDHRPAKDGNQERKTSYVFIRAFKNESGERMYYFTSVTIQKDSREVVISNQEKSVNRISKLLQQGKVAWIDNKFSLHPTTQIEESVPLNDSNRPTTTDNQPALLGVNSPENDSFSVSKDTQSSDTKQENEAKKDEINAAQERAAKRRKESAASVQQNGDAERGDTGGGKERETRTNREDNLAETGERVKGDSREKQYNLQKEELTDEKKTLQNRLIEWLANENIEWAEGKDRNEIIEHFGNTPEPIAIMPKIVQNNVQNLDSNYLYCGKGYLIDHHANHHPELDIDEYINIQTILDNFDDIKDLSDNKGFKIAFVKKLDRGYAVVVELSKENEKIILHKTFFYKDGTGKRIPYKNKPSILEKWSEDGSTSISPAEHQQPADTENISALDQLSESKDTQSSNTLQENEEKKGNTASESSGDDGKFSAIEESAPSVQHQVELAEQETNTHPTEAQKEAGNYKKGHVKVAGFDISIEQPKGSVRSGKDAYGNTWSVTMNNAYGYINGAIGVDGDHIDVFLANDMDAWDGKQVYVVDQTNDTGAFDEHKCMLGFNSIEDAEAAYYANYDRNWKATHPGIKITGVSMDDFWNWVQSSKRKTKAFAEYSGLEIEHEKAAEATPVQRAMGEVVVGMMQDAGVDVNLDEGEAMRELEESVSDDARVDLEMMDDGTKKEVAPYENHIRYMATTLGRQPLSNAKVEINTQNQARIRVNLADLYDKISNSGLSAEEFLNEVRQALLTFHQDKPSGYNTHRINGVSYKLRISNHSAKARNEYSHPNNNTSVVVKLSSSIFKPDGRVSLTELIYNPDTLTKEKMRGIVKGLQDWVETGEYTDTNYDDRKISPRPTAMQQLVVWHGSPASFAAFDHSHMGEGEGAQVHGYGSYVAVDKKAGTYYAGMMNYQRENAEQDVEYRRERLRSAEIALQSREREKRKAKRRLEEPELSDKSKKYWNGILNSSEHDRDLKENLADAQKEYDKAISVLENAPKRNLYEVEIPDNTGDNYLEEDAPLSDAQKQMIERVLPKGDLGERIKARSKFMQDGTARNLYKSLTMELGSDKKASSFLHKAGFAGIHYNGSQDGECYVIFNDKDLKIKNHTQFFKTSRGEVYGFVKDGRVHLDAKLLNPNTPIHEYTHLWDAMLQKSNPKLWRKGVKLMQQLSLWDEIKNDSNYADIAGDENLLASEVHARLSGPKGADLLEQMRKEALQEKDLLDKAKRVSVIAEVKQWLQHAMKQVRDAFGKWSDADVESLTLDEWAKMPIKTLAEGKKLSKADNNAIQMMGSRVDKRMAEIGEHFKDAVLSDEQRAVVDVFSGKRNNVPLRVEHADGVRTVVMRQGNEHDAGTKHSLFRHFGTNAGIFTENDITLVPDVIREGDVVEKKGGKVKEYTLVKDGIRYRVVTEVSNRGQEQFSDFYTNKKGNNARSSEAQIGNTQLSAQADSNATNSTAKVQQNVENASENGNINYRMPSEMENYEGEAITMDNGQVQFFIVTDKKKIAELEKSEKVTGYRSVVNRGEGEFSSPMAYWLQHPKEGAKSRVPTATFELGKWEVAEENAHLADDKGQVTLVKPNKGTCKAAYDPYIHNRLYPVNLQFKDAWKRPDLVYVKTEVPKTDLESGYHADKALLPVGVHAWSNGQVMLSRYDKPVGVLSWDEVADAWAKRLNGKGVNFDVVQPQMLPLLAERGVEILPPHKGMGKDCVEAYEKWKETSGNSNNSSIKYANEQFNNRLNALINGATGNRKLSCGTPGPILLSAGVENSEIVLDYDKAVRKSAEGYKNEHPFDLKDLENLPIAINSPIAVFDSESKDGDKVILTELKRDSRNFIVVIRAREEKRKGGKILDINEITTLFPKDKKGIVKWINDGKGRYYKKEKALNWLGHPQNHPESPANQELSTAAKIVENFENASENGNINYRMPSEMKNGRVMAVTLSGDGYSVEGLHEVYRTADAMLDAWRNKYPKYYSRLTEDESGIEVVDTWRNLLDGTRSTLSEEKRRKMVERKKEGMRRGAKAMVEHLHLDNVDIVEDGSAFTGRMAKAKGFYNKATGKITIILGNHADLADVQRTVLHEAVAHYGLRKLFGEEFDTFLKNVYEHAEGDVLMRIDALMAENGWDEKTAVEEYLAGLAEDTDFRDIVAKWWRKVKDMFYDMMKAIGLDSFGGVKLSDNELRYMLWRSYKNLENGGNYWGVMETAEDIVKQRHLKVGNYEESEQDLLYREAGPVEKHVMDAARRNDLKGTSMSLFIESEEDIDELRKVLGDEVCETITGAFNEKGTMAIYLPNRDLVVVFTNKVKSKEGAVCYWMHEQTHGVWNNVLTKEERDRFGTAALDYLKERNTEVYLDILKGYSMKQWNEEACSYFIQDTIDKYGLDKFMSVDFDGVEEIVNFANIVRNNLKERKYGKEGEGSDQLRRILEETPKTSFRQGRSNLRGRIDEHERTEEKGFGRILGKVEKGEEEVGFDSDSIVHRAKDYSGEDYGSMGSRPRQRKGEDMASFVRRLEDWKRAQDVYYRGKSYDEVMSEDGAIPAGIGPQEEEGENFTSASFQQRYADWKKDVEAKKAERIKNERDPMDKFLDALTLNGGTVNIDLGDVGNAATSDENIAEKVARHAENKRVSTTAKNINENLYKDILDEKDVNDIIRNGDEKAGLSREDILRAIPEYIEGVYKGKESEVLKKAANRVKEWIDDKYSLSLEDMKYHIKLQTIERRRYIETANYDDAIAVEEIKDMTKGGDRKAGLSQKDILKAIPDYIEGTYTGVESEVLAKAAKRVKEWFEEEYAILHQEGLLYNGGHVNKYVTHIWDMKRTPLAAKDAYNSYMNRMRLRSPYTRHRMLDTYKAGIDCGMVPKYEDITGIMMEYGHMVNETVANTRMLNDLKGYTVDIPARKGDMPRKMPLFVDAMSTDSDYAYMNNEALNGLKVYKKAMGKLNNVFGAPRLANPDLHPNLAKAEDVYFKVSGTMKKLNLSFSAFHHVALTETAIASMGPVKAGQVAIKNMIVEVIRTGKLPAMQDPAATKEAIGHLVKLGASNDYAAANVNLMTEQLLKLCKDKKLTGLTEAAYIVDLINKGMDKVLWDTIHDGFKLATYHTWANYTKKLAQKEGWDDDTLNKALDEVGMLVNDTYGGLHFDLLGYSPQQLRFLQGVLLSPDWTLATTRQFFSITGYGTLYEKETKKVSRRVRRKLGRAFWIMAFIVFYGFTNAFNLFMRLWDENEEKKKAEEIRKTNPKYKSPYEIVYPDGMKWYDYTMYGNALGHGTHMFWGRFSDGTECYVRWGKQFREIPEMFYNRDGISFPYPMIEKIVGKANPILQTLANGITGYNLTGFANRQMEGKKGWERSAALVKVLAMSFLPYSIPQNSDKDFKFIDLAMPTSKGMRPYKAIKRMEAAILSGDKDDVLNVYSSIVMNKMDAGKIFDMAKANIETEMGNSLIEGIDDLNDAVNAYDTTDAPDTRRRLKRYIEQQIGAQDFVQIEKAEMMNMAQDLLEGKVDNAAEAGYDAYTKSSDVVEDYRLKKAIAGLRKWDDALTMYVNEGNDEARDSLLRARGKEIETYHRLMGARSEMNKAKRAIKYSENPEEIMEVIRRIRKDALEQSK